MNSINRNQPEENRKDLIDQEAIEKIRKLTKSAQTCFFCTTESVPGSTASRPMNVREVDDQGNLWFLAANDSHLVEEIKNDPTVKLYFQGSAHSDFLQLNARATLSTDKSRIKELWEPVIKTWFTGGVDNPRITVIKASPSDGYYWDNKHGDAVAGIKMLIGAAIGKTMDDSIEGKIRV